VVPGRLNRTFDLRFRGPVRAHRVQRYDAWHGEFRLAGFFDVQNFTALVVSALGTGAVRHLALVTVGALGERVALECVVSASDAGSPFRVSPFWIWHSIPLYFNLQSCGSVIQFAANIFERRPARIFHRFLAIALFNIQVLAAVRTKALTVIAADRLQGQRQQNLLL